MTDPDPSWAAYREEAFGEPYMVWHDGPDFTEFQSRFSADPALATRMLAAGVAEDDGLAAQTPRELTLSDEQRATFIRMLTGAMPTAGAGVLVEGGTTLFVLTGDPAWAEPVGRVLMSDLFWSMRIDAAMRLKVFPPTAGLVAALADGVRDPEYLVRYHSANTLLHWAGVRSVASDDDALFGMIVDDAGPDQWAAAAHALSAAVEL